MLELKQRRAELLARISLQRGQLAELGERNKVPLALADQGWSVLYFIYHRPLVMGVFSALLIMRRHDAMKLARVGWRIWKEFRLIK